MNFEKLAGGGEYYFKKKGLRIARQGTKYNSSFNKIPLDNACSRVDCFHVPLNRSYGLY